MCHRPEATAAGPFWIDDRGGGSVRLYEEANDVEGLQVGGDETPPVSGHPDEEYLLCENADRLVF